MARKKTLTFAVTQTVAYFFHEKLWERRRAAA